MKVHCEAVNVHTALHVTY